MALIIQAEGSFTVVSYAQPGTTYPQSGRTAEATYSYLNSTSCGLDYTNNLAPTPYVPPADLPGVYRGK